MDQLLPSTDLHDIQTVDTFVLGRRGGSGIKPGQYCKHPSESLVVLLHVRLCMTYSRIYHHRVQSSFHWHCNSALARVSHPRKPAAS